MSAEIERGRRCCSAVIAIATGADVTRGSDDSGRFATALVASNKFRLPSLPQLPRIQSSANGKPAEPIASVNFYCYRLRFSAPEPCIWTRLIVNQAGFCDLVDRAQAMRAFG